MENHLRLILFIVGSIILALVIWDMLRQRNLQKRAENNDEENLTEDEFIYATRQQSLDFGEQSNDPWLDNNDFANIPPISEPLESKDISLSGYETKYSQQVMINPKPLEESLNPTNHNIELPVTSGQIQPTLEEEPPATRPQSNMQMFALFVMSRDAKGFEGGRLKRLLESANLSYGKMNIFHKYSNNNTQETLFSVASALEPGSFDLSAMHTQHIPGVTIFMLYNNVTDPRVAFDALVRMAKQLAFGLNGELRDQNFQPLTLQYIENQKHSLKHFAARKK